MSGGIVKSTSLLLAGTVLQIKEKIMLYGTQKVESVKGSSRLLEKSSRDGDFHSDLEDKFLLILQEKVGINLMLLVI